MTQQQPYLVSAYTIIQLYIVVASYKKLTFKSCISMETDGLLLLRIWAKDCTIKILFNCMSN
jgi:hypothetical protein